nr:hypothetical protein [Propionibacteriales bacterium]
FIVALRDPVDLLVSYHRTQLVALNETERDFASAWRRSLSGEPPATTPLDVKLVDYRRVGRLGAAMQRLLTTAPRQDVHVVYLDRLVKEPGSTWHDLATFLRLSAQFTPDFEAHNPSDKMYRSPVLRRLTHRPPGLVAGPVRRLRQWSRTTDHAWVAQAKRSMWRREPRPLITEETRREVATELRDDVGLLAEVLKTDLSHWARIG